MLNIEHIGVMAVCSLAVASVVWTIAKSRIFRPLRDFISERWEWGYELVSCPYCLSHWIAALFAVALVQYRPVNTEWLVVDYIISVFATVTLSTAFAGYLIRFPMAYGMNEEEKIHSLENALARLKQSVKQLRKDTE